MRLRRRTTTPIPVIAAEWPDDEAPKLAKELAQHALDAAHQQAAEVSEFSETLRRLRERNHFGEALDIAMQRRRPA